MIIETQLIIKPILNYIDLATGGLLIQLAMAGFAAGIYLLKTYWARIVEYLKRFKRG